MDINKYRRYDDLYLRPGYVDDSRNAMEWMEDDYNSKPLLEVMTQCSASDFLKELLIILTINIPNKDALLAALGIFEANGNVLESNRIFNQNINKIKVHELSGYPKEVGKVTLIFASNNLTTAQLASMLDAFNIKIIMENSTLTIIPLHVKRMPGSIDFRLNLHAHLADEKVERIEIWYE